MQFPFSATWRDPDEPGHAASVTVLGVDSVAPLALASRASERRGVLLSVKRGDKGRRLLAEQVWADDENSADATSVLTLLPQPAFYLGQYLAQAWLIGRGQMIFWSNMFVMRVSHNFRVVRRVIVAKHAFTLQVSGSSILPIWTFCCRPRSMAEK